MYTSVISTSESLRDLLLASFHADVGGLAGSGFFSDTMDVSLGTPREMQVSRRPQGLSMWLYRVVRDDVRLNDPPVLPTAQRRNGEGPPPLPLRLHYLMTPLASDRDRRPRHRAAHPGTVLQLFHMHPVLSGADLRGDLSGTAAQIHVRLEALSLDETSRVWEARPNSASCIVFRRTKKGEDSPMKSPLLDDAAFELPLIARAAQMHFAIECAGYNLQFSNFVPEPGHDNIVEVLFARDTLKEVSRCPST